MTSTSKESMPSLGYVADRFDRQLQVWSITSDAGYLPGVFFSGESIVMQISIVMLIFLLFLDKILGEVFDGRQTV